VGRSRPADHGGSFRADIQGLRAVAIVCVVLYHAGVPFLAGGYVGVDVFFVISGFLITDLLWRELKTAGRLSFAGFYARRARRLLPMAMLVVVFTMIASAALLPPLEVRSVWKDGLATATYWANYRFAALHTNYLAASGPPSPFLQYWSLGVEEQFYLLWPLLLVVASGVVLRRTPARHRSPSRSWAIGALGIVAASSFGFSLWLTRADEPWAFFSLPSRAWELALGGLLALGAPWLSRLPRAVQATTAWAGLATIVGAAVAFGASTPFPGTAALAPALGAAAVIAGGFVPATWGPTVLLRRSPLQLGGDISYSWYLWHWPLLVLAPYALGHPLSVPQGLVVAAASALVAWLSYVLVEQPARRSAWLAGRPLRSLSAGASIGAAGATVCVLATTFLPSLQGQGAAAQVAHLSAAPPPGGNAPGGPSPAWQAGRTRQPGGAASRGLAHARSSDSAGTTSPTKSALAPASKSAAQVAAAAVGARLLAQEREVGATVRASVDLRALPSNLDPPLTEAPSSEAPPFLDGCLLGYAGTYQPPCIFGDASSKQTVVLFGDSHATMWFPAFDQVATAKHWRLVVWTKAACPPEDVSIFNPDTDSEYTTCNQWRAQELASIKALHPLLVVVGTAPNYNRLYDIAQDGPAWMAGLTHTIDALRASGAHVLVMGPVESPDWNVPDCLSAHPGDAAACNVTPKETHAGPGLVGYDNAGLIAEQRVVHRAGGSFVNVKGWFCAPTTCPVVIGNRVVFFDNSHITVQYAQYLEPLVSSEVDLALLRSKVG
jgi:peptidoglycan/LPS O-acetylase OafA/YrhL